jgi:hypothetical protein
MTGRQQRVEQLWHTAGKREQAHVGRESETVWSSAVSLNRLISDDVSNNYGT